MNTTEPRLLGVEAVADLPVLWATFQRMDLLATLDRHFPAPLHWKGPLTPGEVLAVWLLFLLSEGDHCLNHVQPWVAQHQRTLGALLGKQVLPTHLHDDRLADWLTRLGVRASFALVERDLNQQTIRVYQLPTDLVRIDTTTANSYADVLSEQGLLQFGHSKDDPDRPQLKIAAAILDPLGMPLAMAVVPGNCADDPLYIPAIQAVQQSLGVGGRTYVGDCKMAALATRAFVAAGGDFYLCPLPETQVSRAQRRELLQPVFDGTQALQQVWRPGPVGQPDELVAEGFSIDVELTGSIDVELMGRVGKKTVRWKERRWLVRSQAYAQAQEAALERRLAVAEAALRELPTRKQGKKQLFHAELVRAAEVIVGREGLEGLLSYTVRAMMAKVQKRAYRGRPAREETEVWFEIDVDRDETRIKEKKQEMGWQVYGTNGLALVLPQVVRAYRGQYRIEDDWSRLKGRPLGLTPLYLQNEGRIQGLVYLLSLALRVLTLVEWVVRERLRQEGSKLQEVYAGQPGRKTARPSAELLLRVMKTISVSVVEVNGQTRALLSPLTPVQKRLLELWGMPSDLYENVARGVAKPPSNTSEP
jgi:transposase